MLFSYFTEGDTLISFPEGSAISFFSPLFFFSISPFFVVFNYGLPSGFEFKMTRCHLYIMYFDRLNIISVLKEMKKIINIVKRSGRNPGSFQKARGVKRKFGQIPVRAGAN